MRLLTSQCFLLTLKTICFLFSFFVLFTHHAVGSVNGSIKGVSVTIGNSAFCLALYLTGVHLRGELQHVGDVSEQKFKCRPIRTRGIGGVRLPEALNVFNRPELYSTV